MAFLATALSRQTVTGLVLLAVALTAVVFLVTDVLFGSSVSAPLAAVVLVLAVVTWFVLPLVRRRTGR